MEFETAAAPRGIQNLQFNPDRFPHATLRAFNKFIEPPKHAIEACITKWTAATKEKSTYADMEFIKNTWISKDKVKKLHVFFATVRLVQDWKTAEPNEVLSRDCTWYYFLQKL